MGNRSAMNATGYGNHHKSYVKSNNKTNPETRMLQNVALNLPDFSSLLYNNLAPIKDMITGKMNTSTIKGLMQLQE
jgi:hypothetical protein